MLAKKKIHENTEIGRLYMYPYIKWKGKIRGTRIMVLNMLTLSCIMMKKGQTYFKNLAVFTSHDF